MLQSTSNKSAISRTIKVPGVLPVKISEWDCESHRFQPVTRYQAIWLDPDYGIQTALEPSYEQAVERLNKVQETI